ncbi:MAG TPA: ADOP family duplicated permease [Bryobacteraceae bacterium]|nr:ADOP family duplicated permease [Bryobacteraceae bacterium]
MNWVESLRDDARLGWRRLRNNAVTSAAAILSLALAIGACTSAFRLIDALLLRPLPVAHPERLYGLGRLPTRDSWEYGEFTRLRDSVAQQAAVIAISFAERVDLTYGSDDAMEKGHVQYVSGRMFSSFGLRPAAGRLLGENEDAPVAVLSHDYWSRRFGRDPRVVGHTFRLADRIYEIVGVANAGFTGTEPGTAVDIFMPAAMHWGVGHEWSVFRAFAQLEPGMEAGPVRDRLDAALGALNSERRRNRQVLTMEPAAAGASGLQRNYRLALAALCVLVALVLLIACANVANLMTAQGMARAREMAIRVSVGAGRFRLGQMVLVESAWIAVLATAGGVLFAWWAAPFVVRMISAPDDPARLFLSSDWRVLGFGVALTVGVTFLFGLGPALRVTKGGQVGNLPHFAPRLLIVGQAAFCFLVLFVAGLFVATFERLSNRATGISSERILTLYTVTRKDQPPAFWTQVMEHLREVPGVEKVALADWPILDGWGYRSSSIAVDGGRPLEGGWFLNISPALQEVMKMPLLEGRDFTENDSGGVAIVNSAFARQYFGGANPVGKWFEGSPTNSGPRRFQVVGLVRDARYRYLREGFLPVAYIPFRRDGGLDRGTFIVRTVGANPMAMASILREEIRKARPEFRVSNVRTQQELLESQTVRERLLAVLAMFFAGVALVLAGVGLYGVLNYSVVRRRREIGIRMAIGAQAGRIARLVTLDIFAMVLVGAAAGFGIGMGSVRFIQGLFFEVRGTELGMVLAPGAVMIGVAVVAALPAVIRAVRIDPAEVLRAE